MAIIIKNAAGIEAMRAAGRIAGEALCKAGEAAAPGVTTWELDAIVRAHIEKSGATPSFLGYKYGELRFPSSACISINGEVIHGLPNRNRELRDGDIVSIDVGAHFRGYHGDTAETFLVGNVSGDAAALVIATRESFYKAMEQALPGKRLGDMGAAVEAHVRGCGYSVVRDYLGHGIGRSLHEDPQVPNYGTPGRGARLMAGMTLAVEPMVCAGSGEVKLHANGWTVLSADGSPAAHYEHTVLITDNEPELLTKVS